MIATILIYESIGKFLISFKGVKDLNSSVLKDSITSFY